MDRDLAKRLIDELIKCHTAMSAAETTAMEITDPAQRDEIRKGIMQAAGFLYTDVIMEIASEYPDLNPYSRENLGRRGSN